MSDSDIISLFNNAVSVVLSMIGTFALLIRFGCVFKTRNARIDKTPEVYQESIIFQKDKDAEFLVESKPNQAINPELIKLIEPTQNSETNSANREKDIMEKKKDAINKKKSEKEKLHWNKRNEHQNLVQKIIKPELEHLGRKTQSTQQDDLKNSRTNSQKRVLDMLHRKCRSEISQRYKHDTAEEAHEGFIRTQIREEEPSTLEGVASITRDDAPSVTNQLRITSIKMNLIPKKHYPNKGSHILHHMKRKSVKKT